MSVRMGHTPVRFAPVQSTRVFVPSRRQRPATSTNLLRRNGTASSPGKKETQPASRKSKPGPEGAESGGRDSVQTTGMRSLRACCHRVKKAEPLMFAKYRGDGQPKKKGFGQPFYSVWTPALLNGAGWPSCPAALSGPLPYGLCTSSARCSPVGQSAGRVRSRQCSVAHGEWLTVESADEFWRAFPE